MTTRAPTSREVAGSLATPKRTRIDSGIASQIRPSDERRGPDPGAGHHPSVTDRHAFSTQGREPPGWAGATPSGQLQAGTNAWRAGPGRLSKALVGTTCTYPDDPHPGRLVSQRSADRLRQQRCPQWEGHRRPCEGTWAHCAHALFFAKEPLGASLRRSASEASVIYPPAMTKHTGPSVDRSSASSNECLRPACAAVPLGGVVPNHTPSFVNLSVPGLQRGRQKSCSSSMTLQANSGR